MSGVGDPNPAGVRRPREPVIGERPFVQPPLGRAVLRDNDLEELRRRAGANERAERFVRGLQGPVGDMFRPNVRAVSVGDVKQELEEAKALIASQSDVILKLVARMEAMDDKVNRMWDAPGMPGSIQLCDEWNAPDMPGGMNKNL